MLRIPEVPPKPQRSRFFHGGVGKNLGQYNRFTGNLFLNVDAVVKYDVDYQLKLTQGKVSADRLTYARSSRGSTTRRA